MELRYLVSSPAALVQQLALSTLRYGYRYFVTGMLPERKDPVAFDERIIAKYDIAITDWRRRERLARGLANVKYLRCDRFFLLIASDGHHQFKELEAKTLRCAQGDGAWRRRLTYIPDRFVVSAPIIVPTETPTAPHRKNGKAVGHLPAYEVSFVRRGYQRKCDAERDAYQSAIAAWKASGMKSRRPSKGKRAEGWVSRVAIERRTYKQLRSHFLNIATKRSRETLTREFRDLQFAPYAPVREQLLRLVKDVNQRRKTAGIRDTQLLEYRQALRLKRTQLVVFKEQPLVVSADDVLDSNPPWGDHHAS